MLRLICSGICVYAQKECDSSYMSLAFQSRLTQVVLGLLVVILLVQFVIYLAFAAELIPFPFDYDQGEGHELYNAVLFSEGKCPYCTYEDYPYYSSNYPPVFHLIMMPLVAIFGPQYWIGRTIIFVSTLITGGSIAWAIFRKWHLGTVAAIAALRAGQEDMLPMAEERAAAVRGPRSVDTVAPSDGWQAHWPVVEDERRKAAPCQAGL